MSTLLRLIWSRSEKHLESYRRDAVKVEEELREAYRAYLPVIEKSYAQASYWHGTGHYHYVHPHDSRYGTVDTTQTINVLESILDSGGLAGHQDLWVKIEGQIKKTVSVAPSRMHARLYAHIHLHEGVWLKYVFGGTRFWMTFFVVLAARELLSQLHRGQRAFIKQTVLNRATLHHARTWASAIRNLDQYKILPFWRAYDLRSDIPQNHPMLFGIRKEAVVGDGVVPFLRRLEVRVFGPILLEHFTHIEVPQAHVEEVKELLLKKGVALPVIPLEFGEL